MWDLIGKKFISVNIGRFRSVVKIGLVGLFFCCSIAFNYLTIINLKAVAFIVVLFVFVVFLAFEGTLNKNRILQWLASISYSLYLCHEFIVKGINRLIFAMDNINIITFLVTIACLFASIVCAYIVYLIFEKWIAKYLYKFLLSDTKDKRRKDERKC
jgi:peptidoglycan/LPS O-acetylase OafA/YrhL